MIDERYLKMCVGMNELVQSYPEIKASEVVLGGMPRSRLERPHGGATRYFETAYIPPRSEASQAAKPFDVYSVLFGAYGHAEHAKNFDSRQWGDLAHVVLLAKLFIVELAHEDVLPLFVPPPSFI